MSIDIKQYFGWHAPSAAEYYEVFGYKIAGFNLKGTTVKAHKGRSMIWELTREFLGYDITSIQEVGDCVGVSGADVADDTQVMDILLGDAEEFHRVFSPYTWGMGRLAPDIGNNRLGRQDGSVGAWQADSACEYGFIAGDAPGIPKYSGAVARQYGNKPGPSQAMITQGKINTIQNKAPIRTTDEAKTALDNGYSFTVASGQSFAYKLDSQGINRTTNEGWAHQMSIVGYDNNEGLGIEPIFALRNQWPASMFQQIVDFRNPNLKWPAGYLRISERALQVMLNENDSWSYAGINGFRAREIPRSSYDVFF